jgi:hypothetical protein
MESSAGESLRPYPPVPFSLFFFTFPYGTGNALLTQFPCTRHLELCYIPVNYGTVSLSTTKPMIFKWNVSGELVLYVFIPTEFLKLVTSGALLSHLRTCSECGRSFSSGDRIFMSAIMRALFRSIFESFFNDH